MSFIPLYDENRLRFIPFQVATVTIIALCGIVFLVQKATAQDGYEGAQLLVGFGFVPTVLTGDTPVPAGISHLPSWLTLLSYSFLHLNFWHLAGNMLFLWVFGDNVEDELGHGRFLLLYILCAVAGALAQFAAAPDSRLPLVGASGAIAGVLAAYLVLYPRARVWGLLFARIPLKIPAWLMIGAWFLFQAYMSVAGSAADGTAWMAHVGGFFAGLPLVVLLRPRRLAVPADGGAA